MKLFFNKATPLLNIGFRPFFLGAGVFAVVSIALWSFVYLFQMPMNTAPLTVIQWHAHEMIYGYATAVVAGFLLTAVANWTGLRTSDGVPLLVMFLCWAGARLLYMFGSDYLFLAGILDLVFMLQLLYAITVPIVKKRMWPRMAVVSKVMLLTVFNAIFLLGSIGVVGWGAHMAVYAGLYLIIGLILTIGKNLLPFFITRGVGYSVEINSFRVLDILSLASFLLFFIAEINASTPKISGGLALSLFFINAVRLAQWHTKGIWTKPLLWGLFLSYAFLCVGFLLMSLHYYIGVSKYLAVHAFAVGGIALITLSMMQRVGIGHTGRDIAKPPRLVAVALVTLILCAFTRVILPLLLPEMFFGLMRLSFALWINSFLIFLWVYLPILISPRIDE